ncbi:MAG: RagB/SusD family nutrient uptake outer membrane protein [Prevotella sp.]|nr:RagB/SusD family nutrient uptake outer membrane protein [Prevotella sp.]
MKTINKIILGLFAVSLFSLTSCYDLDQLPNDQVAVDFNDASQVEQVLNGVYAGLNESNVYQGYYGYENCADLGWTSNGWWDTYDHYAIAHNTANVSTGQFNSKWQKQYLVIQRANRLIANMQANGNNNASIIGQAKFVRALMYFNLMNMFGGVPVYNEDNVFEDPLLPRDSKEKVLEQILGDLEYAIANCPKIVKPNTEVERASQGAAYALRGKVYLYNKMYNEAIADFNQVINGGYGYDLENNFSDLFRPTGYLTGADDGKEIIFAVEHRGAPDNLGMETQQLTIRSSRGGGINCARAMPTLINMAESMATGKKPTQTEIEGWLSEGGIDGAEGYSLMTSENVINRVKFWGTSWNKDDNITVDRYTPWKAGIRKMWASIDPRVTKSIILPYEWYDGWGTTNIEEVNATGADPVAGLKPVESIIWAELDADGNPVLDSSGVPNTAHTGNTAYGQLNQEYTQQNFIWRKFLEEGDWGGRIASRSHSPVNWPIIRFADVLLMLAEAYVQTGQAGQAVPLVNRVRGRVGMPGKSTVTMADIEYERCMEFAVEGLRYWDLKRWGKYCSTVNGLEEVDVFGINRQSTKNFDEARWEGLGSWPIPQAEINKNPNLEQNEGWKVK